MYHFLIIFSFFVLCFPLANKLVYNRTIWLDDLSIDRSRDRSRQYLSLDDANWKLCQRRVSFDADVRSESRNNIGQRSAFQLPTSEQPGTSRFQPIALDLLDRTTITRLSVILYMYSGAAWRNDVRTTDEMTDEVVEEIIQWQQWTRID